MRLKHIFYAMLVFGLAYSFTACTKTKNIITTNYDTVTIIKKDTIVIKDTTVVKDTLVLKNPKNPITGYWVGTYTIDANVSFGAFYYGWSIFPDHTIIQQGGGPSGIVWTGIGTWSLSADSTFTCTITNADPSQGGLSGGSTAKYSSVNGTLTNGHTSYSVGNPQNSSFTLKRVGDQ
ncbi:MAG TPA: hypothetical protein VGN00_05150 [Puia sp.]|jgi:hypothetical protein